MASESWHLSKSVPVTLIATLVLQTFIFVWAAAKISFQVENHESRLVVVEKVNEDRTRSDYMFNDRLARIEENQKAQTDSMKRIETYLRGK